MQDNEIIKQYKNKDLTRKDNDFLFALYNQRLSNGQSGKVIRDILILGNRKIVFDIIMKKGLVATDELLSTAMMGLIKAVDTFDISKNFTFSTYAYRVVTNELFYEHRKIKKHEKLRFFSEELDIGDDSTTLEDLLESLEDSPEAMVESLENKDKMKRLFDAMKFLSKIEVRVLFLVFNFETGDIRTQEEVAKIIHKSRTYISKILKSAKIKLKIILSNYETLSEMDKYLFDQITGCSNGIVDNSKTSNKKLIQQIIDRKRLMSRKVYADDSTTDEFII